MKRTPLYSASRRAPPPAAPAARAPVVAAPAATPARRRRRPIVATASLLVLFAAALALWQFAPPLPRALTQRDIDRAVLHTLAKVNLPAPAAKAFEAVRGSVVKVMGYTEASDLAADKAGPRGDDERGVGSGVVIVDNGTILTNLHVVFGAKRIKVVFADGLEAEADVVGLQPQHDLAVLRARKIPDDLHAATMRSTGDLRPGDRVTAVGFPFGIGPSVSHGVVSGLKREFRSPEGQKILTNLIQFDAAANPGNSGGPLVTDDGEVVGIVTAIYNPTQERFFVGIGFAVPIENAAQAAGMPPF
ncbi:MAG TPA: trypsin-like peptidase domain-containing protein [Burkholderiaceae bacterium]|nr:trypsin-like peptidase domain-containing protein [Burkholderiaceae bacterium]